MEKQFTIIDNRLKQLQNVTDRPRKGNNINSGKGLEILPTIPANKQKDYDIKTCLP